MSASKKLEFYWQEGCICLKACPERLVRFHPDEENVTIDMIKNEDGFAYSIGYFQWNDHEPCWELKLVGDRFKQIPPEQAAEVWRQLGIAYDLLTEWKRGREDDY